MNHPPRLAAWLLGRRVWPDERDVILGDLEEQFHQQRTSSGTAHAHVWYWRETLRLSWTLPSARQPISIQRRGAPMLLDDTRYAGRRLIKRPASTLASIVTLAAAIGAVAATWSLLSSVLLRPLPVNAPDQLVVFALTHPERDGRTSPPDLTHDYLLYSPVRQTGAFSGLAVGGDWSMMVGAGGHPESRSIFFASYDYFQTLGVALPLGRSFTASDDKRDAPIVAVLSDRFWKQAFESDPRVLGRTITISGQTGVIVGVAPPRFRGLNLTKAPDLYLPLHTIAQVGRPGVNYFAEPIGDGSRLSSPHSWLTIVGRIPDARGEAPIIDQLRGIPEIAAARATPVLLSAVTASIPTAARAGMTQFTRLLSITVGLLLLIGCLTVGMLLLLGTESRRDELAMCLALGASRLRLARGIALEGALLSIAGALLAPVVALLLFGGLTQFQLPGRVQIELLELSLDLPVLLGAAASAIVASLLIAIVAGAFAFGGNLAEALRARAGATPRLARRRTRMVLISAQVAIAFVLLAGAGLFARSIAAALRLNHSIDTSRLVTGNLSLGPHGYSPERATAFFDALRERIAGRAGIESVAYDYWSGGMSAGGTTRVNGIAKKFPSMVNHNFIDERYFSTVGQPVLRGRDFTSGDSATSPRVAIVSASFARLLADGGDPLGIRIADYGSRRGQPPDQIEIVGVVPDMITSVTALEPLVMYMPLGQLSPNTSRRLMMRMTGDPSIAIREVMNVIKQLDPAVSAPALSTINDQLKSQMAPQQFGATVMGALGVIAAILTLLGTYVLAESMTVVRRREMGIRAALGATRRQLGTTVIRESALLVGVGLTVGLGLAWAGASTIRSFLFQVQPLDVATLAAVAAAILTLALAVSLRPAIRATKVDLAKLLKDA